jgi:proteasome-associated ATPase
VGETERQIRLIFQRAREKSAEGFPVIVFFDEMESLFRTRGSGVSSDVETTIVPQLLAEIDGVESLKDVVVIGASNREDMIDPAILRPGRLDVKIKVDRPGASRRPRDLLDLPPRPVAAARRRGRPHDGDRARPSPR